MDLGAHLPLISFAGEQRSLDDLLAFTGAARDLGYTHLCANDHLVFRGRGSTGRRRSPPCSRRAVG